MPIIPYHPFWDLDKWFDEELPEKKWFPNIPSFQTPKMDIYEEGNNVIAKAELPGVDPKNIDVEVKDNILKIEAKTEEKKEEKEKGYYCKELSRGFYKRAVSLPVEVIGEKAEATYEEGVLKVVVPKAKPKKVAEKKVNKIKVKTKNA